ncbi:alanine/ornithine racemase family PLP-dependent enzyme [Jatrophihabitans sp.]|uniref:alanine/ornithine racemase family PLP-dependent enzyme n=1 Tax=Jatrophihabitans sp. TaxID=1932789 RepID=UPI0030C78466|nr:alanine racemase [Jatrophihabitans sp.]
MTGPRLEIDLEAIAHNTRVLVDRLTPVGIRVTGVGKSSLGSPTVAAAMLRGGAHGIGDSRFENLRRLYDSGCTAPLTLIRSPLLSQVEQVVRYAGTSLNTEPVVLDALSAAAEAQHTTHDVVIMVELGDLREGVAVSDALALARSVSRRAGLRLAGLGTNLACQCGVVPDEQNMAVLSRLAEEVEQHCGPITTVSGGNSANLAWALSGADTGRVNDLRLGEAIMLGTEPLQRTPIEGLRQDTVTLHAEIIELQDKPAQPWGAIGQTAFGDQPPRPGTGTVRQAILGLGRQDVDPDGLTPPAGATILGTSSDHLVLDVSDLGLAVGEELAFGLNYSALVRAMTSPFVTTLDR